MTDETRAVAVRSRFSLSPFEAWVAVVAVYAGVGHWFLAPSGNVVAVQAAFPRLVDAWSVMYAAGGLAVLVGLQRGSARVEAAGLHLMGSGITVSLIAFLAAHAPLLPILVAQGGAMLAIGVRLLVIRRFR